jgi:hypothetical protein
MRLTIIFGVLFATLIAEAPALTISYQITPEIVLPNGYVDCVITIKNSGTNPIEISSISFYSKRIQVEPSSFQNVGNLSPGGVFTLRVSMRSPDVGRQNADMIVSTSEGSFTQTIELLVDDRFPEISLSSPLYSGEVNYAKLLISSPVPLRNVRVDALFNASPKTFFLGNLDGAAEFQFRVGEEERLKFMVSFYNGRSYHEIEKEVKVNYLPSKGISINLLTSKDVLYIGEAMNLSVEIANLRSDEIYSLAVQLSGNGKFSQSSAKLEKLLAGDKKILNFIFSPRESGVVEIVARITYKDFFGNVHEKLEKLSLSVLDSHALQIVNLQKTPVFGKTKISGEVINYGHRSAINAKVSAFCDEERADHYIGEIDANDYETFDLETSCAEAIVMLTWWNEAGDSFSISEKVMTEKVEIKESSPLPMYVAAIASILIVSFVIYVVRRARRK